MQVNARAFYGEGALEHLPRLPLLLIPLLRASHHVVVCLVARAVVDEAYFLAIDVETLSIGIDSALLLNLPHRKSH